MDSGGDDPRLQHGVYRRTVVNVALPALQRELNASLVDVQWVEESFAGAASGINNAASRVAALFSVALFGLIMASIFNRDLHGNVERAALSPAVIDAVEQQRHEILG